MESTTLRANALHDATQHPPKMSQPTKKVLEYFGENLFDFEKSPDIPSKAKKELKEIIQNRKPLNKELAAIVANAVISWATSKGVTHFCHWFQPLTGATAEKHDAFLEYDNEILIEKLSVGQLIQGESDASSFPHGGSRSTFEARGYTSWDMTSPMFIGEGPNGKILYIPTAFVTFQGDALDHKTPLLRSLKRVNDVVTKFLKLTGSSDTDSVEVMVGAEQEYFLIDKSYFYLRPDLVMTGRTLLGALPAKNQQLSDHYFASIEDRILAFMQDLETELYKVGIPCKTRHNEVAPGQYEIASIYRQANITSDQNHTIMAYLKKMALKHDLVALLHEKPFSSINGSGKHLNWSLMDGQGNNLLSHGNKPEDNHRFLAVISIVLEAFKRHSDIIRLSIADHGNDHRLGGHEAPPSIMSVFVGETLEKIFEAVLKGDKFEGNGHKLLNVGTDQLLAIEKDNTDRNRTSPFAFTGNKFEFRAPGSSKAIGMPISVLNGAVCEVFEEANAFLSEQTSKGLSIDQALTKLTKKNLESAKDIVFNGDGYGQDWIEEANKRGLPNLKNTPKAVRIFDNKASIDFLLKQDIFRESELITRRNIIIDRYIMHSEIEFLTLKGLVEKHVYPSVIQYKKELLEVMKNQKDLGLNSTIENEIFNEVHLLFTKLRQKMVSLDKLFEKRGDLQEIELANYFADNILPTMKEVSNICGKIEKILPDQLWTIPTLYEMLFVK